MTEYPQYLQQDLSFSSKAIHVGGGKDRSKYGDMVEPISVTVNYRQPVPPENHGYIYQRHGSPSLSSLEECLCNLEGYKYGLVVSSGMAAFQLVIASLDYGIRVVTQTDLYHGIFKIFRRNNGRSMYVDNVDICDLEAFEKVLKPETKLVWLETPTNPLMKVIDLEKAVSIVRKNCTDCIVVCDNTFMSPYFQRPINFGVDIVMQSCTKYIGGHSDILMGCLCVNDEELYKRLLSQRSLTGALPCGFQTYLVKRSLQTLEVRMQKHMTNGFKVAKFLENHPMVEKVFHPGLKSHKQHEISLRQCYGHSGMMSFYIKGHNIDITKNFLAALKFVTIADSLGGVESTLKIPSLMPPNALPDEELKFQGITHGLVRLSVGIENPDDIIEDLDQALCNVEK